MSEVTRILERVQQGDPQAAEELLPLVYDELRRLAASKMAGEAAGQTLQPTALVHEAWLRLGGDLQPNWENRSHFLSAAAEAMRRILIEKARRRARQRHGGGQVRLNLDQVSVAVTAPDDSLLALDEALHELEQIDPAAAQVVSLRFFAGLPMAEVGAALGVSEKTIHRRWAYARAWIFDRLQKSE